MKYPNNDLWSVRQIEFLRDALDGYENTEADFYPNETFKLEVPKAATYTYRGVLHFPGKDRTIIFEQGEGFGLSKEDIISYTNQMNIKLNTV